MKLIPIIMMFVVACGCAQQTIHFTSTPSGATVHFKKLPPSFRKWKEQGKTPCSLTMPATYNLHFARLTYGNQAQEVELHPQFNRWVSWPGRALAIPGGVVLATGLVGGEPSSIAIGGTAYGAGFYLLGKSCSYTNTRVHVDFISTTTVKHSQQ